MSPNKIINELILLFQKGQFSEILRRAEMLTSEISESSNLNNLIGAASHALGDIIEAEKCFRKAIELNPSNSESHNNLGALLQHQGKLSAGMNVAVGILGTGLEGAITSNLGADILIYSDSKGLFTGAALKGSAFIRRNDLNTEYYGGQVDPKAIVVQHAHQNPQADELRGTLSR